ncbi:hypothetical protein SAMN05216218_12231, partial [Halorientalis regularis]
EIDSYIETERFEMQQRLDDYLTDT